MDRNRHAVVLTGGDPVDPALATALPPGGLIVAADSGLHAAAELGLHVDIVVGDLDSADPDLVAAAVAAGATVERHPPDKDATDLELALRTVANAGIERVVILGGKGGRLDHFLANALLLASPDFSSFSIVWCSSGTRVTVVRNRVSLHGTPGDLVTLLPVGGRASGVTTTGLRWPLCDDALEPGTTRGVSNELTGSGATVALQAGVLLVIHITKKEGPCVP